MNEQLVSKIRACNTLPSLPTIAMEVLELAQKEEVDLQEIASTITRDPALAGKILKTVNSSFYSRTHAVSTVSHALVVMGLQSVKTLVLGFSLVSNLSSDRSKGFNHLLYWRRSIYSATAARIICERCNFVQLEEAFLAALLKDIGMLVLDRVLGEEYGQVLKAITEHESLAEVERAGLGLTHADAGNVLASSWKLPELYTIPILHHHSPETVSDPQLQKLTQLVWLAGRCADVFVDEHPARSIATARKGIIDMLGCTEVLADDLINVISKKTREVASLFEINIGSGGDYADILKRANEALIDLSLQTQMQASQLQVKNQELIHKATTDGLTGLSNRAHFDEFISQQFARSVETGKPLSLILMDVDKFKSINDRFGHPAGDAVLKYLGKLLRDSARSTDLAARYGGEELCIILPDTPRPIAAAVAESLRRVIEARPVTHQSLVIPITASLGVATFERGVPFTQHTHLLKAADLAVYKAKHSGRNNVKIFTLPQAASKAA